MRCANLPPLETRSAQTRKRPAPRRRRCALRLQFPYARAASQRFLRERPPQTRDLPEQLPFASSSLNPFHKAAVDGDRGSRNITGALRCEKHHQVGEFFRFSQTSQRNLAGPTLLNFFQSHVFRGGEL